MPVQAINNPIENKCGLDINLHEKDSKLIFHFAGAYVQPISGKMAGMGQDY